MNISEPGKVWLMREEGVRLRPYDDRTGKTVQAWNPHVTIGVGYLMQESEWERFKDGISQDTALHLMESTLRRFEECINTNVHVGITQAQFDALCVFCYNIGTAAFMGSSALKMINKVQGSKYSTLEAAWLAYKNSNGKPVLLHRRQREYAVFSGGYSKLKW